jgi:transposase
MGESMGEEVIKKSYSASEKATIALEALKGNLTYNEITKKYGVHATQVNRWKNQLKEGILDIFSNGKEKRDLEKDQLIDELYKKVGQLEIERDWLKKKSKLFGQ